MPDFTTWPLWGTLGLFAAAAFLVWRTGVRFERTVEGIVRQTRLNPAFGGLVLLPIAGSLPELATVISGARMGNAALVTNNLLGGVAMQAGILVVADFAFARGSLTSFAPKFSLLLGGVSLVISIGVALAVMAAGEPFSVLGVGLGAFLVFCVHITLVTLTHRVGGDPRWEPVVERDAEQSATSENSGDSDVEEEKSLARHWIEFGLCAIAIFIGGWTVMNTAEAITRQTGMSASFIGATLVAIATSLPELSTVTAAVRRGHHEMAISNVFGSNLYDISLLFVADIFYRAGPLLGTSPRQAMFTGSLGLVMTCVYLWGLLERRDRTVGRFGIDSLVAMIVYFAGLAVLYQMG